MMLMMMMTDKVARLLGACDLPLTTQDPMTVRRCDGAVRCFSCGAEAGRGVTDRLINATETPVQMLSSNAPDAAIGYSVYTTPSAR